MLLALAVPVGPGGDCDEAAGQLHVPVTLAVAPTERGKHVLCQCCRPRGDSDLEEYYRAPTNLLYTTEGIVFYT